MTEKKRILRILNSNRALLNKYSVSSLAVFGSVVRNESGKKSDLDLIVEFKKPTFKNYFELKEGLEKKTGKKVDLLCGDAIKPAVKESILKEAQGVIMAPSRKEAFLNFDRFGSVYGDKYPKAVECLVKDKDKLCGDSPIST